MNREIKFRAYNTVNQKMYPHKDIPILLKNVQDDDTWKYMQYTGCKDKNGKEIYEYDAVKTTKLIHYPDEDWDKDAEFTTLISVIEFHDGEFRAKDEVIDWDGCGKWGWNEMEVIGNIYENPELI